METMPPPVVDRPRVSVGRIILLIADGIVVMLVVLGYVFIPPRFEEIFKQQGSALPALTQLVLDCADGWTGVILGWNVVAILILLIVMEIYSRRERLKWFCSSMFLTLLLICGALMVVALFLPMINMIQAMQGGAAK